MGVSLTAVSFGRVEDSVPITVVSSVISYNIVTVIGTAASRVYFHLKAEAVRMGE